MNVSLSEQLILGILTEQPRHGYDIEKLITDRGMRKWTDIGFSSIYYVLDKLEVKELVASTNAQGKEKKQYSITNNGLVVLNDEAKELIAERKPANTHFMTGLATSHRIEASEIAESLKRRKAELTTDLNSLQSKQSTGQDMPLSARQLFSLSEVLLGAELHWVNEEIERIKL